MNNAVLEFWRVKPLVDSGILCSYCHSYVSFTESEEYNSVQEKTKVFKLKYMYVKVKDNN